MTEFLIQHTWWIPLSGLLGAVLTLPWSTGIVSRTGSRPAAYNAQAHQIPADLSQFTYGALSADPLPIGGTGIPPTLLMQDLRHFLPEYLYQFYCCSRRGEDNLRVPICQSFQKSMFCVTTSAIRGLAPYPLQTKVSEQRQANRVVLETWMQRLFTSRLPDLQGI